MSDLSTANSAQRIKEKKTAQSDIIPELHKLGKDLRLLQHLFKSYKTLIQTILTPPDTDVSERIKLDQQARDRFRRLGDRLQLLMLNTIKEYLNEKSELSSTVGFPLSACGPAPEGGKEETTNSDENQ